MADLPKLRGVAWLVPMLLVVAVVAVVLLVAGGSDDDAPDDAGGSTATATTEPAEPTTEATQADPATWCAAFRAFADAQASYVSAPDDAVAEQGLVDASAALLDLGQPIGLSEGGLTSLRQLVDGALNQAGDPTVAPGAAPADPPALDAYLTASCPA